MMRTDRRRVALVVAAAVVMLVATAGRPAAQLCGNAIPDPGEECDHGEQNGLRCCDIGCKWKPDGAQCIPGSGDACHQGVCDAEHFCLIPQGKYVDPCARTAACRSCVVSGASPKNFSCTGEPSPDGTLCADEPGAGHLCTVDACKAGRCAHRPKECPASEDRCLVNSCDPKTGECEMKRSPSPECHRARTPGSEGGERG